MASDSSIPVFLLKTKSSPTDGYEHLFGGHDKYSHVFVPVLEHHFNSSALEAITARILDGCFNGTAPPESCHGGLIFTSQRAVEAFIKVVQDLRARVDHVDQLLPVSLPLYVVGPATGRSLASLGLECPIRGEESGNGEVLASFILQDYNKISQQPTHKPGLLFLVGEQRRDIIPKTLQSSSLPPAEQIKVDELTVYETGVMDSFGDDFKIRLDQVAPSSPTKWAVVFSPTGCKAMLEILGMLDGDTGKVTKKHRTTKIATIGPTTRDYLMRTFEFEPDACAKKPSPEGVLAAIEAAM